MEITEEQKTSIKRGFSIGFITVLMLKILHRFSSKIPA
jgi:hypothetical protein